MTTQSSTTAGGRRPLSMAYLLPLALYAYPALRLLLARSEVPLIFGRYSSTFFVLNLISVGIVALIVFAWRRGAHRWIQFGYLALIGITILVPMNNQIRYLSGVVILMPAIRWCAGLGCMLAEFDLQRSRGARPRPLWMLVGVAFVALSLIDYGLLGMLALSDRPPEGGLRVPYDLEEITERDVVLVGDSFVWGEGVELDERFGDRLELIYSERGDSTRVYSLGETGIGPIQYAAILSELGSARAGRVVVAFYMNDMPAPETLRRKIQDFAEAFGRGFPSARLVGDKLARLLSGDVHAYHRFVVDSYRQDHESYAARWAMLEDHLQELGRLSAAHSEQPPLMLVIPIMVDFADYPLDQAHRDLAELAEAAGFETLDLLPVFRDRLGDGDAYRSSPGDNHFDAGTHQLVAEILAEGVGPLPE